VEYPNWFRQTGEAAFAHLLGPLRHKNHVAMLQVGAFVGHASAWLCSNVLQHSGGRLHDVDTWAGSDEAVHRTMDFTDVERAYDDRMRAWMSRGLVTKYKMTSDEFFNQLSPTVTYDFVYIDGDHHAAQVFTDANNAHRHLNVGGIVAFDDFIWSSGSGNAEDDPCPGIWRFATAHINRDYELIAAGSQLWLRRVA